MQRDVFFQHRSVLGYRSLAVAAAMFAVLLSAFVPARAVPVTSLYVVMVPGTDPAQAVQAAMRVELVRLTGRRSGGQ